MEVSLCAISSSSYSPASTSSFPSPSPCVRLLRKEFLGNFHNLRPPGLLRSRRQCKKLGLRFHFRSKGFILRASLDSSHSSEFVVAVAAVSAALAVVFRNNSKTKERSPEMQASGQLNYPLLHYVRSMLNSLFAEKAVLAIDSVGKVASESRLNVVEEMNSVDVSNAEDVVETPLNETQLINGATLASEVPSSFMIASNSTGSVLATESDGITSSPTTLLSSQLQLEVNGHDTVFETERPTLMVETKPCEVSLPAVNVQREVTEFSTGDPDNFLQTDQNYLNQSIGDDQISCTLNHNASQREELYTFYEAPMAKLNGLGALSNGISLNEDVNSLLFKDSPKDYRGKFPRLPFSDHADELPSQGESPVAYHKDTSPWKENIGRREGSAVNNDRKNFTHNGPKSLFPSHSMEGTCMDENHAPKRLSAYNQFLRDGRLNDCVEMLEEMESMGLLDMDNIYHARFFQACKRQKAIKEAFRFTKLIPNPTLSTFNMLMSVCAIAQDLEGAFEVLKLVDEAGYKIDCKLYTTLISTCARSGKVDTMFKVFHEMVNAGVEPNVHTYSALIDGCAKAGQVAKAFGAYGIMQSKNVKPDRVVFNALITACGESGAVDRAFDVLAEMRSEVQPVDPDHITIGALMKACIRGGQFDRAREVYKMIDKYNIKGTPEVYTIALNSCSHNGDWEFACNVYDDMIRRGVAPDETFISALIDVAGHAGKLDAAFEIQEVARAKGINSGIISYSSLMGACSNAKDWHKALQLYENIKNNNLKPTVSMMNALITALCDAGQLRKAVDILFEMKKQDLSPNTITYSVLLVASEKEDDLEVGLRLLSEAKKDGVAPNLVMLRCVIGMCLRRFQRACTVGEPVFSLNPGRPEIDSKWTSLALMVYREGVAAGVAPTVEELSQVLGCLKLPYDLSLRNRLIENIGVSVDKSKASKLYSLVDGFGEYDPRAFSLLEEAASLGIIPAVSLKRSPIFVDVRDLPIYAAEVYILTVLKGLKHRLAAGVKLPNLSIMLPLEETRIQTPSGEKIIKVAGRASQAVAAMLRRLGLQYIGHESRGKIRVNGVVVKKWFQPKLDSHFSGQRMNLSLSQRRLGKGISYQQRNIRTGNLSLD
ncbi:OLC1v1003401C2 [Oldenlandia corymbosa var. corymbosa]|uniref:OLC1v1003401C2 n=1 Tax=Oldenlandia corymbosa var. corymbosa TaxID=529605 RepID=A0AAV1DAL9_OLDCO|nr:OLC1v1003401C2 [Oldenlandia corymbosa var. corymbosa]